MLNKGLRDEESIRIDNTLKTLLSLVFVPNTSNDDDRINIEKQLGNLGLSLQFIADLEQQALIEHLQNHKLDWNNMEQFADFLMNYSRDLSPKAIAIYNFIQKESKTFSFEIYNKIAAATK